MSTRRLCAAQIEDAIVAALRQQDVRAVPPLLTLLAAQDPARAQVLLDTIEVALAIATSRDDDSSDPGTPVPSREDS